MAYGKEGLIRVPDYSSSVEVSCPETVLSRNAREALADVLAGSNHTYSRFPSLTNKLGRHAVFLDTVGIVEVACICRIDGHNLMLIQRRFLETIGGLDQERLAVQHAKNSVEIYNVGYPFEIGFLLGCEETHHHLHQHLFIRQSNPRSMNVSIYDSVALEYEALLFQLKTAQEKGFSPECVRQLQHRVVQADRPE